MQLVVAHKGKKSWRCRVRGHEAHSSLTPQGVNAVQIACEIVAYIARACARVPRRAVGIDAGVRRAVHHARTSASSAAAPRSTSCRATARSISRSAICRSTIPTRSSPTSSATRDVPAGDARGRSGTRTSSSTTCRRCPASTRTDGSEIADARPRVQRHARDAARFRSAPRPSLFHNATIPTVICGPGHIEQAHQPNEWVEPRPARALRSVHAPAGRPASAATEPSTLDAARVPARRRSMSRFPISSRWAAGNTGMPLRLALRGDRAGPQRHGPGADARQRGVRRDRARLAAARAASGRRAAR